MATTEELIAYHREWVRLHRTNPYQREGTRRMTEVLDALESARRDALQEAKVVVNCLQENRVQTWGGGFAAISKAAVLADIDALIGDETGEQDGAV